MSSSGLRARILTRDPSGGERWQNLRVNALEFVTEPARAVEELREVVPREAPPSTLRATSLRQPRRRRASLDARDLYWRASRIFAGRSRGMIEALNKDRDAAPQLVEVGVLAAMGWAVVDDPERAGRDDPEHARAHKQ